MHESRLLLAGQRGKVKYLHEDEHVNGVSILTQRLGHKPVIVGVHHRAIQDAVHKQQTGVLVQLVLHYTRQEKGACVKCVKLKI